MKKNILLIIVILALTSCEKTYILLTGDEPKIELIDGKAHINGLLGKTFYKKFKNFVEENPNVKDCILEDIPGSIHDEWNVKACLLLHENGMNTKLLSFSEIASGGVDLFISGNRRVIADGARIGVHSWSDGKKDGSEYPKDSEEHDIFLDFLKKIQRDTAFYWFTLRAASSDDIHWMNKDEILKYKLETP